MDYSSSLWFTLSLPEAIQCFPRCKPWCQTMSLPSLVIISLSLFLQLCWKNVSMLTRAFIMAFSPLLVSMILHFLGFLSKSLYVASPRNTFPHPTLENKWGSALMMWMDVLLYFFAQLAQYHLYVSFVRAGKWSLKSLLPLDCTIEIGKWSWDFPAELSCGLKIFYNLRLKVDTTSWLGLRKKKKPRSHSRWFLHRKFSNYYLQSLIHNSSLLGCNSVFSNFKRKHLNNYFPYWTCFPLQIPHLCLN